MKFSRILARDIPGVWTRLCPLLERTLKNIPTHTPDDIGHMLLTAQAQLWSSGDVFAVTNLANYDIAPWLRVLLIAPDGTPNISLETFEAFRKHAGCDGMEVVCSIGNLSAITDPVRIEGFVQRMTYSQVVAGEMPKSIFQIEAENISRIWPQIEPLVGIVLEKMDTGTTSADHVKRKLIGGQVTLMVQWGVDGPEGVMVVEIATYPRGKWLRVWLAAADPGKRMDIAGMCWHLKRMCSASGCAGLECVGRIGWMRRFKSYFPGISIIPEAAVLRPIAFTPDYTSNNAASEPQRQEQELAA